MATVLVVDDDEDIRTAIRDLLESSGHSVYEASNGREALAQVAAVNPSLVLLDMMMPVMGGADVLQTLREDGRVPELPVVVITAQPKPAGVEGARVLIHKPFSVEGLCAVVKALVPS